MISGAEINGRASRFEQNAARNAALDARKAEKERIVKERAAARQQQREQALLELKARQAADAEAAAAQREADLERNRGVYITATLRALPLSDAAAAATGVRRRADKVSLPAFLSEELMKQRAHEVAGSPFWEIAARDGRRTCASALDFSAPDGAVLLPPKVVASLWGAEAECHGEVQVKYRRLEKGTFVRLTPQDSRFQAAVGEQVEEVLQEALMQHTALCEGDWISVPFGGETHRLQVMELQPEQQVSLIDTDLTADVTPSQEFLDRIAEEQRVARAAAERAAAEEEAARIAQVKHAQEAAEAAQQAADTAAAVATQRAALRAALPFEPPPDCQHALLHAMFRLPDGQQLRRRFRLDEAAARVFDVVEAAGAGGLAPGTYRIVTRWPRRVLDPGDATLAEQGLSAGQEVLLLESL